MKIVEIYERNVKTREIKCKIQAKQIQEMASNSYKPQAIYGRRSKKVIQKRGFRKSHRQKYLENSKEYQEKQNAKDSIDE